MLTNRENIESFADTLENYNGVSDVKYSETDYGSETVTFKFNDILHTFVSIPETLEVPEKEDEEKNNN